MREAWNKLKRDDGWRDHEGSVGGSKKNAAGKSEKAGMPLHTKKGRRAHAKRRRTKRAAGNVGSDKGGNLQHKA